MKALPITTTSGISDVQHDDPSATMWHSPAIHPAMNTDITPSESSRTVWLYRSI
ncbi:hypothetical protein yruck0001_5770 [Yersinia ruckeri ATCC 29473]|uniref:Uncharacterized protein n=1 Tax=Yersinia ruckeri TaxID=29486 RepID=A0A0A8VFE8_YERRU|nr:hypothetical protein yruck0001_5770 [Yersinia ruckeri ATCC 29473]CEK28517.1 hypothetical protein CSF007_13925 [Yersinia ruckeri]